MSMWWLGVVIPSALAAILVVYLGVLYFLSERVPNLQLAGKTVIITGGSSGIGLATAQKFISEGASSIAIIARNQERLSKAKALLADFATQCHRQVNILDYSVDVSNYEAMCTAVRDFHSKAGRIDIVVASAGVSRPVLIDDVPFEEFVSMNNINYLGIVATTKAVLPFLKQQRAGRIVLIGSMAGLFGISGYSSYAPTKYAVRGFAEVLYMELKPFNIQVSICNPPDVDTAMYAEEMKHKPKECILMSEGTGVFSAEQLANDIVNGIKRYKFFIQTGFDGHFIGWLTAGTMPGGNVLDIFLEVAMASIGRIAILFVRKQFDGYVKQCHQERESASRATGTQ